MYFHRKKSLPLRQNKPLQHSRNPASFCLFLPKMADPNQKPSWDTNQFCFKAHHACIRWRRMGHHMLKLSYWFDSYLPTGFTLVILLTSHFWNLFVGETLWCPRQHIDFHSTFPLSDNIGWTSSLLCCGNLQCRAVAASVGSSADAVCLLLCRFASHSFLGSSELAHHNNTGNTTNLFN